MNTSFVRQMFARREARAEAARQRAQERAATAARVPAYVRAVAVHKSTTTLLLRACGGLSLGLLALVGWQQMRITELVHEVRAKEFLVVPGAHDFVPIRANLIPDAQLAGFVSYIADQLISVSYRNLQRRTDALAHLMTPGLSAQLDQEVPGKAKLLTSLQGSEVFQPLEAPQITRTTQSGRTQFEATVRGEVVRYALGRQLDSTTEVVTVVFRPRNTLGAEEPWVFEVVDFARRSEDEHHDYERAQRLVRGTP